jgi:hypothetical protein
MTTSCLVPTVLTSPRIERASTSVVFGNRQSGHQTQTIARGTSKGSAGKRFLAVLLQSLAAWSA